MYKKSEMFMYITIAYRCRKGLLSFVTATWVFLLVHNTKQIQPLQVCRERIGNSVLIAGMYLGRASRSSQSKEETSRGT